MMTAAATATTAATTTAAATTAAATTTAAAAATTATAATRPSLRRSVGPDPGDDAVEHGLARRVRGGLRCQSICIEPGPLLRGQVRIHGGLGSGSVHARRRAQRVRRDRRLDGRPGPDDLALVPLDMVELMNLAGVRIMPRA